MSTWSTLNKGVTASTKDAVEIQVEKLLETYRSTLKLHQKGQFKLAKQNYEELISNVLVKNEPKPKKKTGNISGAECVEESPLSTLRFLVFKNYATFLKDEFVSNHAETKTAEKALQIYLQAVKIDPSEHSLWYHIGYLSEVVGNLRFARLAYETGFYIQDERALVLPKTYLDYAIKIIKSGKFMPMQWKCLEGLCNVLYEIGDYRLCIFYLEAVMERYPTWELGIQLKSKLKESNNTQSINHEEIYSIEAPKPKGLSITLEKYDWSALVKSLLTEYRRLVFDSKATKDESDGSEDKKKKMHKSIASNRLAQTPFVSCSIQIIVEKEEEPMVVPIETKCASPPVLPIATQSDAELTVDTEMNDVHLTHSNLATTDNTLVTDDMQTIPVKRKRDDEEENIDKGNDDTNNSEANDTENDEESEAEEKRLSLRASKRQQEKVANEEFSRLKMLEEEKEFTDKVQAFYDKIDSNSRIQRQTPWYNKCNKSANLNTKFWSWFDCKIAELDSSYCWDIINPTNVLSKNHSNSIGDDTKTRSLALFVPSNNTDSATANQTNNHINEATVRQCISQFNTGNSGITDCLYRALLAIIKNDLILDKQSDRNVMNNEFLDLLTDSVSALELNFVNNIQTYDNSEQQDRISIILRICEYFVDRLIRGTMSSVDSTSMQVNTSQSRRKLPTSLMKQSKLKALDSTKDQALFWISLLEKNLFSSSLKMFFLEVNHHLQAKEVCVIDNPPTLEEYKIQLRYWTLKGKMAQCNDDIEEAYNRFTQCKHLLESSISVLSSEIVIDLKSEYDTYIDLPSVDKKLSLLQVGKLYATAKSKMISEDYKGVIEYLEAIVKPKVDTENMFDSNENITMSNMLAKAHAKCSQYQEAWDCYSHTFCRIMDELVKYGENQMEQQLSKNEDTVFLKLLGHVNSVLDDIIDLLSKSTAWSPEETSSELMDELAILLRMSIIYVFRHLDFVPLVNNFTNPDVPPHTPSKITKVNAFNDIVMKVWVLQSHILQQSLKNNKEIMLIWAELLQELHDELGEREVCGAADRILLKHLMTTLIQTNDIRFRRGIYQCYHCLYGVHIAPESDMIEEHHCVHSALDTKASESLFALITDSAVEKLVGGALLKTDLKDVVETVSKLFEELPTTNAQIKNNQSIIETYLDSDIELRSSFNTMLRHSIIPTTEIDPEKTNTSLVLYKIFWIRGKTLRLQIKNRAKSNNEKKMDDLDEAIEEFTSHIILSPNDPDGWYELGACFQQLADEELNWSASNIGAHRDLIAKYQRKSCHAYMRGLYLGNLHLKELAKSELFTNFGNLLYSVVSSPMNMESFKVQASSRNIWKNGKVVQVENIAPSSKAAYKLATIMYSHVFQLKTNYKSKWRCCYMLGKCLAKIGRPPKEVLDWYLQAIRRTKSKIKKRDEFLEPVYIFYSALAKYLYTGKLEAKDVEYYLSQERLIGKLQEAENEPEQEITCLLDGIDKPGNDQSLENNQVSEELAEFAKHLPTDTAQAYNSIFLRISDIRMLDGKNYHHRPIYRLSWMYYHIYHNTEKAKSEMMKLFTLKSTVKNHINIWKHGFELPGKHYEYISKYTLFLIELARESNDTQTLKNLYRKLRRGQTLVLDDKKVFGCAYTSYLQVIKTHLQSIHHAKDLMDAINSSQIEKNKFEMLCSATNKTIDEDKSTANPELYLLLQDLAELKRLIQGFSTSEDTEKDGMDEVIQMCYTVIVFGGEANMPNRTALENDSSVRDADINIKDTTEDNEHQATLHSVLLVQAKELMQGIPLTAK